MNQIPTGRLLKDFYLVLPYSKCCNNNYPIDTIMQVCVVMHLEMELLSHRVSVLAISYLGLIYFIILLHVFIACVYVCIAQYACGDQGTTCQESALSFHQLGPRD